MLSFKETIKRIKQQTVFSVLRVLGFVLLLLVLGISFILWQQWNAKKEQFISQPVSQELADQQKKAILESLSASAETPQYTDKEKEQILQNLSAPLNKSTQNEEEKKRILELLSVPSQ